MFAALFGGAEILLVGNDEEFLGDFVPFVFDGFGSGYGRGYLMRESRRSTS